LRASVNTRLQIAVSMNFELCPASELPDEWVARWDELLRGRPELASPYFRPEFIQAVARVRDRVEVACLRDGAQIVGFFPFERAGGCVARPVGGRLSDYQAVIAAPHARWQVGELLSGCRLKAWEFDHHLASQEQLAGHFSAVHNSWQIDIRSGFDQYVAARKAAGAGALGEMLRKFRKLQRERRVRFEWHVADKAVFERLLAWKSEQYRRSQLTDLFAHPWIVDLLKQIRQTQTAALAGVLSVLYADDEPAAIHFGMQSGSLLHSWFPAYDVALGKYSPGAALLLAMLQHAGERGIVRIDLGKGDDEYKLTLANAAQPVAEGVVETRPVSGAIRQAWRQTRDWVRRSPIREPARMPIRWLRHVREWLALR
jgi:CelD/BcsL family acetyltransferase involved in cellulose biosynthesis